jgi:ribonuclease P protein component
MASELLKLVVPKDGSGWRSNCLGDRWDHQKSQSNRQAVLPKPYRLRSRHDFSAVYRGGLRRTGELFTLRVLQRPLIAPNGDQPEHHPSASQLSGESPTRLGISVSQKVSKRAVVRNRIKRQIRAAFRELLPHLSPGWDLVVIVHPKAIECKYGQFLQQLEQLLARTEVLNGHSRGSLL